jgi:MscS family membrane protein
VAWVVGFLLNRLTRRIFLRLASRTTTRWDDEFLARIGYPLTGAWALGIAYLLLPWLALYEPAEDFVHRLLRAGFFVVFFWGLARALDVGRVIISSSPWAQTHANARALLPLASRVGKVLLAAIAVVALLSELGYPVASLVAGLGIGGLAVALAAQKSLENLFGAFSIGADQPFREGDFVRIEDFVGHVEIIGLRSTKFRTLDRTLITIPNGKLSDMRLETFAVRDRMRLACFVRLKYGTTSDQMRAVLEGLERVLREHPKIWPDSLTVRLNSFGESSLDIEVMAWFQTPDWDEFMLIRQEMLLSFMAVVEEAGASLAIPTRSIHMVAEKLAERSADKSAEKPA